MAWAPLFGGFTDRALMHGCAGAPDLPPQVSFVLSCLVLVFVAATYVSTRSRPVYLLNYHCFKPPSKR